jgi:C4-dicarboxylate-specific signal transduction histidine kinase
LADDHGNRTPNEPNHAIVMFEDIDAARRVSQQLEDLRRDLQHVGRVNTMGQFAAGLAHELNQPLSAIMHDIDSAQVLIARDAASTTEIADVLKDIASHAERSGEIIRALRDLIQNDRTGVKPFLLQKLLEQTVVIMEPEAKAYGAQIVLRIDKGLFAVANRSQIAQVLVNLIRNSLEASTRDPVNACVVTIKATVKDEKLDILVEDNGPGIPKHLTPFSQFASTRPGGMGLGLSICKSLVEAKDGSIWYEEMKPRGTRFIIRLPCHFEENEETGK